MAKIMLAIKLLTITVLSRPKNLNLKIASLADYDLIEKSRKAVNYFVSKYQVDKFPEIKRRLEEYRIKQISRD